MLRVEAMAIGDELLDGRVTDTNGSLLARELRARGVRLGRVSIVPDELDDIVGVLEAASRRSDVIVCSGGMGPTDDDRTRHAAARWLGVALEHDPVSMAGIEARFASVGMTITPNNRRQADFPAGATVLETEVGTAPGFMCQHPSGLRAFFLPGVPREYAWFLERHVMPALLGQAREGELARRTIKVFGLGESAAEHALDGLALSEGVTLGYRAHFPEIHLTLTAWSDATGATGRQQVEEARAAILGRLGRFLVAEGDETLPGRVVRLLTEAGATVTTAESCTGGLIAQLLTSVAGSSACFEQGAVTYSNEAKQRMVGVDPALLEAHGAVSREVVVAMARGAAKAAEADYAMAASGIAGPGGGTPEKPVGTVEVAVHTPEGTYYRHLAMRPYWGRQRIRQVTAHHALAIVLKALEGRIGDDPGIVGPLPLEGA